MSSKLIRNMLNGLKINKMEKIIVCTILFIIFGTAAWATYSNYKKSKIVEAIIGSLIAIFCVIATLCFLFI